MSILGFLYLFIWWQYHLRYCLIFGHQGLGNWRYGLPNPSIEMTLCSLKLHDGKTPSQVSKVVAFVGILPVDKNNAYSDSTSKITLLNRFLLRVQLLLWSLSNLKISLFHLWREIPHIHTSSRTFRYVPIYIGGMGRDDILCTRLIYWDIPIPSI